MERWESCGDKWYIEPNDSKKEVLLYIFFCEEKIRSENGKSIEDSHLIVHWILCIHLNFCRWILCANRHLGKVLPINMRCILSGKVKQVWGRCNIHSVFSNHPCYLTCSIWNLRHVIYQITEFENQCFTFTQRIADILFKWVKTDIFWASWYCHGRTRLKFLEQKLHDIMCHSYLLSRLTSCRP